MVRYLVIGAIAASVLVLPATAQRGGGRGGFGHGGFGPGFSANHGRGNGRGFAYFGDPFLYTGYPTETYIEAPPQFVTPQPAAAWAGAIQTGADPLTIELQGSEYVPLAVKSEIPSQGAGEPGLAAPEHQRTVLVYLDGHREEVRDYAIAQGVAYVHYENYPSGTKSIRVSALDIPATVEANQQRGMRFLLPTAPNVVVASF